MRNLYYIFPNGYGRRCGIMWKNITCEGTAKIEKLVGKYDIWELDRNRFLMGRVF